MSKPMTVPHWVRQQKPASRKAQLGHAPGVVIVKTDTGVVLVMTPELAHQLAANLPEAAMKAAMAANTH